MREDSPGVGLHSRQLGNQCAVLELAAGHLDLGGQAQAAELVSSTTIVMHWQQSGAGTVGAGVELEAKHAQSIQTEADSARRVAGAEIEQKTLCPFLAFRLTGTVAEVAVEIVILQRQVGLAVFEKAFGIHGTGGQAGRQGDQSTQDVFIVVHLAIPTGWRIHA
ncbi:hypothetical protein D3C72_1750520 [compost metagenome]